jgi:nitrogen regulatory protein PII
MSSSVTPKRVASIHRLKEEVERLSQQQAEAMKMAKFGGMTISEVQGYGARHDRIIHLLKELAMFDKVRS